MSKIKPHFFSLRADDYLKLKELQLDNNAINVLTTNPTRFFSNFSKYTRNVADELKQELYMFCFQIATDRDRNRIESLVYKNKKTKKQRKEVAA